MAKGSRPVGETNNDNSVAEIGDLRDMMQILVTEMGNLAGKVSSLEKLDHAVMELRNQISAENRRHTVPLGQEGVSDGNDGLGVPRERERSPRTCNNSQSHQSNFNRWSRMEFLRF
ncbi:hypothetical protein KY290_026367 [Solanum tuberosum]|uniref:Integrase core domain containing protein n=1 Tax=Solanum tuberosum TaxID=4113 RepID=A0ABQ7UYA3_SOLTU|nr:hypothetical protein KY289_025423 [Solanum tuberosum]KAH0677389.1 hypothetical protein KY285_025190 [Solanum tuberosum]KAH0756097.1 hypothetical protein KY290_026367 [Solanum tuberosum]